MQPDLKHYDTFKKKEKKMVSISNKEFVMYTFSQTGKYINYMYTYPSWNT